MTAGLNFTGRIWRFSYPVDDIVGGAVPTGTIVYPQVFARIQAQEPTLALLEQGIETPRIYEVILAPGNLDIRENDQFEVTGPNMSSFKNEKFRILGVQQATMLDPRGFMILTMRRIERANVIQ